MATTPSDPTRSVLSAASRKLGVPGASSSDTHLVKDAPGYTTPIFKGKEEQRVNVERDIIAKVRSFSLSKPPSLIDRHRTQGFIPRDLVPNEVNWFYNALGIDDTYFQTESRDVIADHIMAL